MPALSRTTPIPLPGMQGCTSPWQQDAFQGRGDAPPLSPAEPVNVHQKLHPRLQSPGTSVYLTNGMSPSLLLLEVIDIRDDKSRVGVRKSFAHREGMLWPLNAPNEQFSTSFALAAAPALCAALRLLLAMRSWP